MAVFRRFCGYLGKLLLHIMMAILVGALLLSAVRLLPAAPMDRSLEKSAVTFQEEGVYPNLFPWCTSQLDSTTDALILLISACDTGANPLVQAMTGSWNYTSRTDAPSEQLADHYGNGTPFLGTEPYYQYWHGYQVLIRPLLSLLSYNGIRLLNGLVQAGLLLLLCWMLYKNGLARLILPWLVSICMLMPLALAMSLQYSSCYYVLTVSSILLLWKKDRMDMLDGFLFLYTGIAAAYFDFLTYPIATLGVPAVFYFCLRQNTSIRDTFCRGVKLCFSWAVGYVGMWSGKWLLGSLVLGQNILSLAAGKLAERSGSEAETSAVENIRGALSANLRSFLRTPATLVAAGLCLILLVLVIRKCLHQRITPAQAGQILFPFVILALLPITWYVVTAQHAVIHYWFTHKALVVSVFAALAGLTKLNHTT